MYKVLKTPDKTVLLPNGNEVTPVVTLTDGAGRAQIIKDDGCFVLLLKRENNTYHQSPYWFPEASKALVNLLMLDF